MRHHLPAPPARAVQALVLLLLLHGLTAAQAPAPVPAPVPAKPVADKPAAGTPANQAAAPAAAPLPALGKGATEVLANSYAEAAHWALRAIVLMSLGGDWHPAGVPAVLDALRNKDERVVAYGLEALRGMDDEALRQVATAELVDELIGRQLDRKNKLFHQRLLDVLARALPEAKAADRRGYEAWWLLAKPGYAPPAWTPPAAATGGGTVAGTAVERAFDLRDAGLDVAIVIDSTGSMQLAIDTARDAIDDVVALLAGIAPKLRLGLVHYKDFGDLGDGAKVLAPLTKDQKDVREKLGKLVASGGGDVPERVECGFEAALGREMGWNKDANKLVLIVGDAPPHDESIEPLLARVRGAREQPSEGGKGPVTGAPKKPARPFVTSTVATNPAPKHVFARIASAGGGVGVVLDVPAPQGRGAPPRPAPGKPADKGMAGDKAAPPPTAAGARQLVEHVLLLSFGGQHQAQLQRFVRTYFEFRDAGLFR
ncbi:MAG: vWA domain-containing protein [Planctomycetota bacterium]